MRNEILPNAIHCPYCGEVFEILIDGSVPMQTYTEDCEVCCRPIILHITVDEEGEVSITPRHEDE